MRPAVLFILRAGGTYTVSLETPAETTSILAGTVTVSSDDRRDVLKALERVIGADCRTGHVEPEGLSAAGRLMFSLFLPRPVQDFVRTWDGPLVISTNDPAIPWELLHNGEYFIGIGHAVGRRLVSARTPPARAAVRRERPAFLFIADPRGDLPGAAEEAQQLARALGQRGFPCDLLLSERASYLNVQEALGGARYDVIHYAGHAHLGQCEGAESALDLAEDRWLPASQIERVLRGAPLVFLNACSSGLTDEQAVEPAPLTDLGLAAENLASAFIFGGAQGFIGTLWPVDDVRSRAFAATFYDEVLAGRAVGEALRSTRQHVHEERPSDPIWASFVLYGDPTFQLSQGQPAAQPKARGAAPGRPQDDAAQEPSSSAVRPASVPPDRENSEEDQGSRWGAWGSGLAFLVVVSFLAVLAWQQMGGGVPGLLGPLQQTATPTLTAPVATHTVAASEMALGAEQPQTSPTVTQTPQPPPATRTPRPYPPTREPEPTAVRDLLRGRLAFVTKLESGRSLFYVMRADRSERTKLGAGVDPDWSPDGERIAFAGLLEEEPGIQPGIRLIKPDGSGHVRLTTGSDWQPTWSPDGERIAFMTHRDINREIYLMNADGSGLRGLSNSPWEDKHPSWSPAGDKIAFISNRSGAWQVWVMNTDGGNQTRLTQNEFDNFRPVWSPDSTRIAYGVWNGTRNEIWVMDADGGNPQRVTANQVYKLEFSGYGLAWAPQPFISFVSNRTGQPQIFAMQPDGSQQTMVTEMPAGAFSPAWTRE